MPDVNTFFGGEAAEQVPAEPQADGASTPGVAAGRTSADPQVSGATAPEESVEIERHKLELAQPDEAPVEAPEPEPQFVTTLTPSGLEVLYQWSPKRLYRVRQNGILTPSEVQPYEGRSEWTEVPSVTTILGCLDKSGALTWWGMKVGVDGVAALAARGLIRAGNPSSFGGTPLIVPGGMGTMVLANAETVTPLLTEHQLTVNHVKESGGRRGQSAHDALEAWAEHGRLPNPEVYDENERGYVIGLRKFLEAIDGKVEAVESEVMVGSLKNEYAGRYDVRWRFTEPVTLTTRIFPKKADVIEEVPAGAYLPDLKTSKYVYSSHFLQLEAYEGASVESGYEPTEHRAVIHVTADGRYEFCRSTDKRFLDKDGNPLSLDDFLAVKGAYHVTARKGWK